MPYLGAQKCDLCIEIIPQEDVQYLCEFPSATSLARHRETHFKKGMLKWPGEPLYVFDHIWIVLIVNVLLGFLRWQAINCVLCVKNTPTPRKTWKTMCFLDEKSSFTTCPSTSTRFVSWSLIFLYCLFWKISKQWVRHQTHPLSDTSVSLSWPLLWLFDVSLGKLLPAGMSVVLVRLVGVFYKCGLQWMYSIRHNSIW